MKTYIETLTETRNAMIAEYYELLPKQKEYNQKMVEALRKQDDKEAFEKYFKLENETASRINNLWNAINDLGHAIGRLDRNSEPETFWGK